jgi:uncharacterized OB-fold protein
MSEQFDKNLPQPTAETAAYWEGCRKHQLLIQRCTQCGHYQFYPRIICTACMSDGIDWVQASGHGRVLSFTVIHRAVSAAYKAEVPYVLALIELDEGPTMMSNVIEMDAENVAIGMPVEVVFEEWSDEITIPKFRPANATNSSSAEK